MIGGIKMQAPLKKYTKWISKKYKSTFKGKYEKDSAGERIFVLIGEGKMAGKRIVFESWQMAKKSGWTYEVVVS